MTTRNIIDTDDAPAAVGPYSQAIRTGNLVFTAGQIAIDPASGHFVGGDVTTQTRQALTNLRAVLHASGSGMEHVVKTTIFLTTMDHYAAVNQVYAEFFSAAPPARSAVAVAELPLGALVEIECVAVVMEDTDN
ncbi:MAG: RidA family protein [Chloroflexota bacterium]|nr:RidA family protein [Chloroflexota bacterium]